MTVVMVASKSRKKLPVVKKIVTCMVRVTPVLKTFDKLKENIISLGYTIGVCCRRINSQFKFQ